MIKSKNYAVLDIETTGLLREDRAEIIEIGVVVLDAVNLKEIGQFKSLIKPNNIDLSKDDPPDWSAKAFEVNKITFDELREAPDSSTACNNFVGFLKSFNMPILVGQNIYDFDYPFLQRFFAADNKNINDYVGFPTIDIYPLSYLFWRFDVSVKNLKLGTIAEKTNVELEGYHRAINDARATADIFRKYANFMSQHSNQIADVQVKDNVNLKIHICPQCGGVLSVRKAKNGKRAGSSFVGCNNYFNDKIKCKFTCLPKDMAKYLRD